MRKRLLMRPLITAVLAVLALGNAGAQESAQGTDLRVMYLDSPTSSGGANKNQKVTLTVMNNGTTDITHFKVGVLKDGVKQFEEDVNQDIPVNTQWPYPEITLNQRVNLEYGETSNITAYAVAEGDVDQTNDTAKVTVTMPPLVNYPYTWNDETAKNDFHYTSFWGMGWGWSDDYKAFYQSGKSTNWMGALSTDVINFTPNEPVTCSFDYGTAGETVTLISTIDFGDSSIVDTTELAQSTQDFSPGFFSFTPAGPAIVSIQAKLGGEWNAYGSIFLRNINFKKAVPDLAVTSIKSPLADKIAVSDAEIPVTATFSNASPFDIANPQFSYKIGDKEVSETYNGTIAGGTSIDYTFTEGFVRNTASDEADTLTIWCDADNDENLANDTVKKALTFYQAVAFPYTTDFGLADRQLWTVIDNNADGAAYSFGQLADGSTAAIFGNYQTALDEYLISPAITLPEGTHRVSFYYSGYTGAGTSHLKLLAGQSTDVSSMKEVLFDKDIDNTGWVTGYHLLSNLPAGNWYFAFALTGSNDASIITHFKVDDGEDLCINSVKFDTKSGFGLGKSKVTISYVNQGITAQKDVKVKYYVNPASVNGSEVGENEYTQSAEETVAQSVAPGDTIFYTFNKEADLSTQDTTYYLIGQITSKIGEDQQNDLILGDQVENWAAQTAPYYYGFNDETRNQQWTAPAGPESSWTINNSYWFDYDGNRSALSHIHAYTNNAADDWAYSEAIQLKKGKYEVSFFYRGRTYFSGDDYTQKFEAKLGTERTPEAMTTEVFRTDSADVYGPAFAKVVKVIDIPEDGQYYLGFHDFSTAMSSETHIDAVSIEPVTEGRDLPFESDFANDSASWTIYQANSYNFTQWAVDGTSMVVNRDAEDGSYNYFEGMLVTPKLKVAPGAKVTVDVDYALTSEQDTVKMNVYTASVNNPSEFTLLGQSGLDKTSTTFTFTNTTDSVLYVGLRTNTDINDQDNYYNGPFYTLTINSVKVSEEVPSGINTIGTDKNATVVARYNLEGQRVGASHRGVTILKMSDGTTIKKVVK